MKHFLTLCAAWMLPVAIASAATLTVVNTSDQGPGSLRRAIAVANSTADVDTIGFAIPETDPGYDSKAAVWTIVASSSLRVKQPVVIDGYTQPGARPNANPTGEGLNTILKIVLRFNVPESSDPNFDDSSGLITDYFVHDCTFRGLVFNGVANALLLLNEGRHKVEGNFFGTDAAGHEANNARAAQTSARIALFLGRGGSTVGGLLPEQRNLFAGRTLVAISAVCCDTIQGNLFGTTVNGRAAQPLQTGIEALGGIQVGGTMSGAANVLVANGGSYALSCHYAIPAFQQTGDNVIEGNFIGTDVTGQVALGGNTAGVFLDSDDNRLRGNVISGNKHGGVSIGGQKNVIIGNRIGTDATGAKPIPNGYGISLLGDVFREALGNRIGGVHPGEGNVIAFNRRTGVVLPGPGEISVGLGQASLLGNSIFANGGLGIDLNADGVTRNDNRDSDAGPNQLQNHPILTGVEPSNSPNMPGVQNLRISGRLQSGANRTYRIELFADTNPDPSEHGEGRLFLGATKARTGGDGSATFEAVCPYPPDTTTVSATATNAGNTSEFSRAITIVSARTQLLNLSARARIAGTSDKVLVVGLITRGNDPKRILLRGIGPSLRDEIPDAIADPILEVYDPNGVVVATNDDWKDKQAAEIRSSGLAPKDEAEAAIVTSLAPDQSYTAVVRGKNGRKGTVLLETYDLDPTADARLANLSARGWVAGGDDVLIGGIITGPGSGGTDVILRAIGPSLQQSGVEQALADPVLELRNADGELLARNDNWRDNPDQALQVTAAGIPPRDDLESAIAVKLPPGASTAILRSFDANAGVALVEVYDLGSGTRSAGL